MPNTESKSDATLVIGAGELGMAVIRALCERRSADGASLSVLLRPGADDRAIKRAKILENMGLNVVRADLATETDEALAAIFMNFSTVICCTGFVGGAVRSAKLPPPS